MAERRKLVQSILFRSIDLLDTARVLGREGRDPAFSGRRGDESKPCSLCLWKPPSSSSPGEDERTAVTSPECSNNGSTESPTTSLMMEDVVVRKILGLDLDVVDLHFCDFCSAQMQNLLVFKEEVEKLGERLADMVKSIRTLLTMPQESNNAEEEPHADIPWLIIDKVYTLTDDVGSHEDTNIVPLIISPDIPSAPRNVPSSSSDTHMMDVDQKNESIRPIDVDTDTSEVSLSGVHSEERIEVTSSALNDNDQDKENDLVLNPKEISSGTSRRKRHMVIDSVLKTAPNKKSRHHSIESSATYAARPFPCPRCPLRFTTNDYLTRHALVHLPKEERSNKLQCPHCPSRFLQSHVFKDHLNTHLPPEKRPYWCAVCQMGLSSKVAFKRHGMTQSHMNQAKLSLQGHP